MDISIGRKQSLRYQQRSLNLNCWVGILENEQANGAEKHTSAHLTASEGMESAVAADWTSRLLSLISLGCGADARIAGIASAHKWEHCERLTTVLHMHHINTQEVQITIDDRLTHLQQGARRFGRGRRLCIGIRALARRPASIRPWRGLKSPIPSQSDHVHQRSASLPLRWPFRQQHARPPRAVLEVLGLGGERWTILE